MQCTSDIHARLYRTLLVIVAVNACTMQAVAAQSRDGRPNVLLIAVDDLNDWVEPLGGHPQSLTPNFKRLAERGVTFTNAHCSVPICSPSRTSLMTGVQPYHSGVFTNGGSIFDLDGRYETLPEHFAAYGYRTSGAGKLFHGSGGKYAKFFQTYGPGTGNQGGPFTREELDTTKQNPTNRVDRGPGKLQAVLPLNRMPDDRRTGRSRNNSFDWGPVNVSTAQMPDGEVAAWAVKQLDQAHDQPFFMGVGFYRPHQPLFAPEKYFAPFQPEQISLPSTRSNDLADLSPYARKLALLPLTAGTHATVVKHDQWDDAVSAYLACVHFVDDLLGQVIDALDRSPHARDTWIVLFSDHGYHLGERRHWGKFTPWRESTRVPLIIVPPKDAQTSGFRTDTKVAEAVSLIDIYPTLIELCGLPQPSHSLDGKSLRDLVSAAPDQSNGARHAITTVGRGTQSIVDQRHRYIRYFDGSEELYDWKTDPQEWNNVADDPTYRSVKEQLAERLPDDPNVAHYVRYGDWKAVLFRDDQQPLLYPIAAGTGSGGGIGETKSVADEHPEVVTTITQKLANLNSPPKRITLQKGDGGLFE